MRSLTIGILAVLIMAFAASADVVTLKQGQTLTGSILADKEALLILDIGYTALSIPKDDILQYQYSADANEPVAEANEPPASAVSTQQLYRTADLEDMSIEKSVEKVAEAVVKVSTPGGLGSGFFINEQGYLITNCHVIEQETKIEVTIFQKGLNGFEKKTFKKVKIEALNPFIDLALLKVEDLEGTEIKYVCLGNLEDIRVGQQTFAIGTPLGLERTVTDGVISTKNRSFEGLVYLQTNADINPGNSGGPLFNLAGEVIGVTNMGYIFFGGLGFAIPVDYVKHFIENRESFAYDKDAPNTGYRYLQPDSRENEQKPDFQKN